MITRPFLQPSGIDSPLLILVDSCSLVIHILPYCELPLPFWYFALF